MLSALSSTNCTFDAETTLQVLTTGLGRRARDKARVTLRSLERRAARLRASLQAAEERLERLAGERGPLDLARAIQRATQADG